SWLGKVVFGSVLVECWPSCSFFTLLSVVICVACEKTGYKLNVSTVMLSVLSTMLSFVISLRTSSAVERYGEGRRAFSGITLASRNLALLVWLHVPPTTLTAAELASIGSDAAALEVEKLKGLLEKRTIINLIQAFSVSAKRYLRGESGVYYEDLYDLIACLPRYAFPSSVASGLAAERMERSGILGIWRSPYVNGETLLPCDSVHSTSSTPSPTLSRPVQQPSGGSDDPYLTKSYTNTRSIPLLPAFNPPPRTIYHWFPPLLVFHPFLRLFSKEPQAERKRRHSVCSNIPLEISLYLSGYVNEVIRRGTMVPTFVPVLFGTLGQLQDSITTLERVLTTPLPWAYQIHLRATTYAYLVFLPFQIYSALGYLTILATFVAATIFLGFLELGTQLENPFDSDLDLDHFCELIAAELREIVAHPQPAPSTFVFSPMNSPFLPADPRPASEIL
ncbi:Bestrophin, RFP-TM, chloride channel-domain-containing protein, partial [Leucosporidium creatinivorum]